MKIVDMRGPEPRVRELVSSRSLQADTAHPSRLDAREVSSRSLPAETEKPPWPDTRATYKDQGREPKTFGTANRGNQPEDVSEQRIQQLETEIQLAREQEEGDETPRILS
eukprot:gnl/MRDRNA2_/MRDRNA2_76447_c0_seq2.p2 gnl/MRDRNA2_/MRDRNA2_76447_c0~~gnl/MRDRNA2_/MRDRNA2_76447_c0_seq2.p2  ORF type:complete len:110 (+),score=16.26 gnl/MRDRNA2_/MRDRNA2_76447_c0_seq2:183-512(+)